MITCKLGEKEYWVDYVTGRALREMGAAAEVCSKLMQTGKALTDGESVEPIGDVGEMMDTMVEWFCVLFRNQFTIEEVYDGYPADRLMHDVALALMAVQNGTTEILTEFPTKPAAATKKSKTKKD